MSFIVAIDGPAGSGKGTIAKKIAEKYGLINIDSGAMYRCVALKSLNNGISLDEKEKIIEISDKIDIVLKETGEVLLDGIDVTNKIRSKEVSDIVSQISSITKVRLNLVELQRKIAEGKRIVMEGRDITTYVFPSANVKIYLDASEEVRAKRRYKEMQDKGIKISYKEVLNNLKLRDENDKHKEIGSLMIAPDATVVDSTNLSINQVVEEISTIIDKKIINTHI